jgi:hypothetical protein
MFKSLSRPFMSGYVIALSMMFSRHAMGVGREIVVFGSLLM